MNHSSGQFAFRKHDTVGVNDAEMDTSFLHECFEDTGDISVLADLDRNKSKCIVVGRTGAGKTALLLELQEQYPERVIRINPETLSLNYVSNSNTVQQLTKQGLNLDPFYKLLWRHVLAVSILQERFDITTFEAQQSFFSRIAQQFDSSEVRQRRQVESARHKRVVEYMQQWGSSFFETPEFRTQEVTKTFESQIQKSIEGHSDISSNVSLGLLNAKANVGASLEGEALERASQETRTQILKQAQSVVNSILVQQLTGIVELIDEILDDPQKPVYLTIDRLDEDWVIEDEVRLRLLKGLLDTVKEFVQIKNCKLIIAMRYDLLHRLFRDVRSDTGFQEDKYSSLRVSINWSKEHLVSLLDKRIAHSIRDRYTKHNPSHTDILPAKVRTDDGQRIPTIDYMLQRTWMRPRDLIEFFNNAIEASEGSAQITKTMLVTAEGTYSRRCLRALAEEWHADYPHLPLHLKILLTKKHNSFKVSAISNEDIMNWAIRIEAESKSAKSHLEKLAVRYVKDGKVSEDLIRSQIASVFYRIGIVGIKLEAHQSVSWANKDAPNTSPAEINDDSMLFVHPALWRVLGVATPTP